jgi:hypothetical protein
VSLSFGLIVQWWDPAPTLKWALLSMAFGGCLTSIVGWAVTWSDKSLGVKSYVLMFVFSSVLAAAFSGLPKPDRTDEMLGEIAAQQEIVRKEAGRRFDRIEELLTQKLGSETERQAALIKEFPFGYVILDMASTKVVTPHANALSRFQLDVSMVRYRERGGVFDLVLPTIHDTQYNGTFSEMVITGDRREGFQSGTVRIDDASMVVHVLEAPESGGMVIAMGFQMVNPSEPRRALPSRP